MSWMIHTDHINKYLGDDKWQSAPIEVFGPHDATEDEIERLRQGEGYDFKIYDDDGILYYSGRNLEDPDGEKGFDPLDHYGRPDSGANEIRYEKHDWSPL